MISGDPLLFGYYTTGTPYEREADSMRVSCEALGLQHEFVGVETRGTWQRNTQMKPEIVGQFLERHPGRRLVYLDVDAYVICRPELFWTLECDFAAHLWDRSELLSGTLFMRANEATTELVRDWQAECQAYPDTLPDGRPAWDQRCLMRVVQRRMAARSLRFEELPHEYCWMIGLSQQRRPDTRPVILHKEGGSNWKVKPTWKLVGTRWVEQ